ncbi:MAG: alpha-L-fucosidase [Clostridia bacterium]|nr:alpha-L-fucosidase [Clostridia bacterium]
MENIDRFFGLHFDFHAGNDTEIGVRTNIEDIEKYILDARPDFIQCDCKGHPGNSSYPTKVGKAADKLVSDNLRAWCDAAKKHNLPIFMHYSGVWDTEYCKAHPEDAAVDSQGNITEKISLYGNYVHKLLIPQLKELIDEYGIDGVWIDGDCWAVSLDYSEHIKPYLYEGITEEEHKKVMHDAFLNYVKTYTDELHKHNPNFKVISNWLYSSYTPEKPTVDIDFISGDYPSQNSVHAARYEGRCIAAQNKPWDLMAWAFGIGTHYADKPAVQLMQEAASVLCLGGGFQMYITQNKDGSARQNKSTRIKEIGEFVRARRMLYGKKPLAQIAVYNSAESFYKKSNIFNAAGATEPLIGTLNAVLDAQFTANVLLEYQLENSDGYEAVIIPQWEFISDENKKKLLNYAENGGNLVVIGAECSRQFAELAGVKTGKMKDMKYAYIMDDDGGFADLGAFWSRDNVQVLDLQVGEEFIYSNHDLRDTALPAFRIENIGKGKIAFIPFDFGSLYFGDSKSYIAKNYLSRILKEIVTPFVEINRGLVDITMQEKEGGLLLNLVNMRQGRHELRYVIYNEVTEVYNLEITINKVFSCVEMPLGEEFKWEIENGKTKIYIDRLDIHSIIDLTD